MTPSDSTSAPAKPAASVGEWVWRFIAVAMVFALGWMAWVIYLLNPPPLVTPLAFEASARARAAGKAATATGQIGATASAPAEGLASGPAEGAAKPAAAPAESAPAPVAAKAPEPPAKPSPAELLDVLEGWARAWSTKDVDAYLAHYAKDFKVPGGESREAWEKTRRARITAPKSITVTVDKPKVDITADDKATVVFSQTYKSDIVVSAAVPKTIVLVRQDGRWLIQQETSGQ